MDNKSDDENWVEKEFFNPVSEKSARPLATNLEDLVDN